MTFDIGIIKLVTTLLVVRSIDGYEISTEHVTWDEIDNVCKQHFLPKLFTNEVKDGLTKLLPSKEKFWLRAKSRPTNFLIWKGCHELQISRRVNQKKLKSNSISSCISKTDCTTGSTIALKGDTCICIKGSYKSNNFPVHPQKVSDQTCPGNLNEDCGCPGYLYSVYTLKISNKKWSCHGKFYFLRDKNLPNYTCILQTPYYRGKEYCSLTTRRREENDTRNTASNKRGAADCITESFAKGLDRLTQTERSCDDEVTSIVRCLNRTVSRFYIENDLNVNWLEARRLCQGHGAELGGYNDTSDDEDYPGKEYWTPKRSSFQLMWTGLLDNNDKQCIALIKDNSGVLQLSENDCSSTFRAVCETSDRSTDDVDRDGDNNNDDDNGDNETKFPVLVVVIAAVGGVVVLWVIFLGIVCWKRRNRRRKRSSTVNNRFYDQVVCSNVPTKEPAQPKLGQDSNQGQSSNAYQSVDPVGENNTTADEGHYDVTFTHSNNTHTLPVASGNIYDRCYGKSTGTPIDRTTYDNAESDHNVSASTDTDHYDTTRNVLPKSGAKVCTEGDYDSVINTCSSNKDA